MKNIPLYLQIIIGLFLGITWGVVANITNIPAQISHDWIEPIGIIFIRLLKMIAVPLVIASLIVGIANLNDISKLSRMGGRTVLIYIFTTVFALTVGMLAVNLINPGKSVSEETRENLLEMYSGKAGGKLDDGEKTKAEMGKVGPLAPREPPSGSDDKLPPFSILMLP